MGSLSLASADCTVALYCCPGNMKDWERLIPAANMGEYEPPRERPEDGGLYPLNAEGTYGRGPKNRNPGRWQELPKYQKREKKPKLYASYAISDKCELHSLVLDKYMRRPKCSVHSSSGSGRSSRATSAPPQNLTVTEVKEKTVEKSSRQASLPPVEVGSTMMLKVEDLDMLARLKLAREKEEDCMESLVDLGEAEDGDEEDAEHGEEDESSELSSRSTSRQSVESARLTTSDESANLKMEKKKETYMESTGLVLQEDNMTTYVV